MENNVYNFVIFVITATKAETGAATNVLDDDGKSTHDGC